MNRLPFSKAFRMGFLDIVPILTGIVPFGAVMGTVAADAGLNLGQILAMDHLMFAGTAQLAATELMTQHAASVVVVLSGLIINLRFLLYSAALAPVLREEGFWTKLFCAYSLTDQSYAVMSANEHKLATDNEKVRYYMGTAVCMLLSWHLSVVVGFVFGNVAPQTWALDYAVPLSFVALVLPTLKNKSYVVVALFSLFLSIALDSMPYRIGLIITALCSIALAIALSRALGRPHDRT